MSPACHESTAQAHPFVTVYGPIDDALLTIGQALDAAESQVVPAMDAGVDSLQTFIHEVMGVCEIGMDEAA